MSVPYQKIHGGINPASGKDEIILNTINDVFYQYSVDWDVSITKKYSDGTQCDIRAKGRCDDEGAKRSKPLTLKGK